MWSDIFYPGNPERRRTVVQLSSRLMTLMEENFRRTNGLIDVIHQYIPGRRFMKIVVDHNKTIRDNCNIFIQRTNEIQNYMEEKRLKLKEKLDPSLYEKIMDINVTFAEKLELGRKIAGAAVAVVGSVAGIAVTGLIVSGVILVSLAAAITVVGACAVAGLVVAVLFMGVDMIISAIVGAQERDQLERTIADLRKALDAFEPASYEYSKNVEKIIARIEMSKNLF